MDIKSQACGKQKTKDTAATEGPGTQVSMLAVVVVVCVVFSLCVACVVF